MTSPTPLATVEGVKAQLNIPAVDTSHDVELGEYVDAATVLVEEYRAEAVLLRTVTEENDYVWDTDITLGTTPVHRIVSATRVADGVTWDPATFKVKDAARGLVGVPATSPLSGRVEIVYEAGYVTIPANIRLATKIIVAYLWETQQQPGVGPRPIGGAEQDYMTPSGLGSGIPDRAIILLGKRPPMVA